MLVDKGIVRIGTEIEVADWKGAYTYQNVAAELIDAGAMEGTANDWKEWHRYNCDCELGCLRVKRGDLLVPPIVSMQYDASLPTKGAEFIVSPVLMVNGMEEMKRIFEIVTEHANWRDDIPAMRGNRMASPSIHLHVSATLTDGDAATNFYREPTGPGVALAADFLHSLSLFGVELILLSDIGALKRRGLAFRQPWREADGNRNHHGFIDIKKVVPERMVYIEWRMFEAAYKDWNYLETAAYLSAGLTRALLNPHTQDKLMTAGYRDRVDHGLVRNAIGTNNTTELLKLASGRRLGVLADMLEEELEDDDYGRKLVRQRFEEVGARV